jgi:galactokinase
LIEVLASAPGRVNLLGEHTDYNGGFVLPTVIPQRTTVKLARRADLWAHVKSRQIQPTFEYRVGDEKRTGQWSDYVQGVTWVLRETGYRLEGFDAAIDSEVPLGAGLSSSAALEVALLRGLRELFGLPYDEVALATLGRRAENGFVGAPVGILDQMACALGDADHALFLDTRTLEWRKVWLPQSIELLVIDSGVAHAHVSGGYMNRKTECDRAASLLGVPQLRDIDDLSKVKDLPAPLNKRVRHVVSENARVLAAVSALESEDLAVLGKLMRESHASQRDDYEVSVPEVDLLVNLACAERGVWGARLTGGGFGGSIVAVVDKGLAAKVGRAVVEGFARHRAGRARVLVPPPLPLGAM